MVPLEEKRSRSRPWRRSTSPDLATQLYGGDHASTRRSRLATFADDGNSAWAPHRKESAAIPKEKLTDSSIPVADSVASNGDGKLNNINGFSRVGELSPKKTGGWQRRSTSSPPSRSGISGVGVSLGLSASTVTDSQRQRWAAIAARNAQHRQQQQQNNKEQDQHQDYKLQRTTETGTTSEIREPTTSKVASSSLGRGNFGGNFNNSDSLLNNDPDGSSRTTSRLSRSKDRANQNYSSSKHSSKVQRSLLPPSDLAEALYGGANRGRTRSASPDLADLRRIAASVRSMPSPEKHKEGGSTSFNINTNGSNEASNEKKLDVGGSDVGAEDEETALRAAVKGMQAALSETSLLDSDNNNEVKRNDRFRQRISRVTADAAADASGVGGGGGEGSISRYVASRSLSPSRDSTLAELRRLAASVRELRPPLSPRASLSSAAVSPTKGSKSKPPLEEKEEATAARSPEKLRSTSNENQHAPSPKAPGVAATYHEQDSAPKQRSSDTPPGTPPLSGSLDYSLSSDQDWPPADRSLLGGPISSHNGAAHHSSVAKNDDGVVGQRSADRRKINRTRSGRGGGGHDKSSSELDRSGREFEDDVTDENSLGASTIAALDPDRLYEAQRVKRTDEYFWVQSLFCSVFEGSYLEYLYCCPHFFRRCLYIPSISCIHHLFVFFDFILHYFLFLSGLGCASPCR